MKGILRTVMERMCHDRKKKNDFATDHTNSFSQSHTVSAFSLSSSLPLSNAGVLHSLSSAATAA